MTVVRRLVSVVVVLAFALTGPLGSIASAQQPQPQPDLFQESLKATGQPPAGTSFQAPPRTPAEPMRPAAAYELPTAVYHIFAGIATGVLIPGRAITCSFGSVISMTILVATLGTGYRTATRALEEGCGGKWIVTGDDLRPGRSAMDTPIERY
jgi:hypothetical protein